MIWNLIWGAIGVVFGATAVAVLVIVLDARRIGRPPRRNP